MASVNFARWEPGTTTHAAGSENNWVWLELLSKHMLLLKDGRVVAMPETGDQVVAAASAFTARTPEP